MRDGRSLQQEAAVELSFHSMRQATETFTDILGYFEIPKYHKEADAPPEKF